MIKEMRRSFFPGFTNQTTEQLLHYPWPGNVRELKSVIERAVYHSREGNIIEKINLDPFDSPFRLQEKIVATPETEKTERPSPSASATPEDFKAHIREIEQQLLLQALKENRYNQRRTAEALSLSYHQLRGYLKKYNISTGSRKTSAP